jgi:hypothetical protein
LIESAFCASFWDVQSVGLILTADQFLFGRHGAAEASDFGTVFASLRLPPPDYNIDPVVH